ncbi:MAG TPA: tetratricopeptide repeat protein, partial [Acidimicrobiales bacterium]|nr:tetratricopeptide repeat protein [Acidimicrobiales bacterium]
YESRPREVWDAEGRRAAAKALDLEPNLSEVHTALSLIHWDDYDYAAAERDVKRALALNPSNAEAHYIYATLLQDLGRAEEAIEEYRLTEAADPLGVEPLDHYAQLLLWLGRTDEALGVIEKYRRLEGNPRIFHALLSDFHLERGDTKRALEEVDLVLAEGNDPSDPTGEWQELTRAWRCHLAGDDIGARAILAKVESAPTGMMALYLCGLYYAELGDVDGSFRCWERGSRIQSLPAQALRLDPSLEPVRKDPRFARLLREMGLA